MAYFKQELRKVNDHVSSLTASTANSNFRLARQSLMSAFSAQAINSRFPLQQSELLPRFFCVLNTLQSTRLLVV